MFKKLKYTQVIYKRLIISGSFVEYYEYEKPYFRNFSSVCHKKKSIQLDLLNRDVSLDNEKPILSRRRNDSYLRAKNNIKRLIMSNPDLSKMLTLTFKDNISDLSITNKIFNNFIKRLRRVYPDLKYIAIPEFQKRGAVHYHMLTNINTFVHKSEFSKVWNQGFVLVKDVYNQEGLFLYLIKYLTKDLFSYDNKSKRKYLYSYNMLRPVIIDKFIEVYKFFKYFSNNLKLIFDSFFDSLFLGKVKYCKYKLIINFSP